jgi:ABC-2 type transport system permease protein
MKALAIAATNVRRMLRDRLGLFFVFVLPTVIIVVMGIAFGGQRAPRVGVAVGDGGPLAAELVATLDADSIGLDLRRFESVEAVRGAVERGEVEMGLAIPAGYDAALRSGAQGRVVYIVPPTSYASAVRTVLDDALHGQAALVKAARYAAGESGVGFEEALATARAQSPRVGGVSVSTTSLGKALVDPGMNGYLMGAQSQLILFMFLTSMTAATQLILSRQLGVSRRMLSTPTSARTIVLGELLGRFAVAMLQGLFIVLLTGVVFGVDWGDPLAASAIVVAFALVGTGVAMLVGSVASNADQASSLGVGVAMLLGAFGGAMVPPEVFPDVMRTLSFATPHAWAIDGLRDIVLRDADLLGVARHLAVLSAFAGVLLAVAVWRFRRSLAA